MPLSLNCSQTVRRPYKIIKQFEIITKQKIRELELSTYHVFLDEYLLLLLLYFNKHDVIFYFLIYSG